MEREKFEESWKNAFEEAEATPSQQVWKNIQLELEKAEGGQLKQRLMFYQMLAAASVVFAMAIGGVAYYHTFVGGSHQAQNLAIDMQGANDHPNTSTTPSVDNARASEAVPSEAGDDANDDVSTEQQTKQGQPEPLGLAANEVARNEYSNKDPGSGVENGQTPPDGSGSNFILNGSGEDEGTALRAGSTLSQRDSTLPSAVTSRALPPLHTLREIHLTFPSREEEIDPVAAMLAGLEQREKEIQGEEKKKRKGGDYENLWTSVGFAAGSFTSVQAAGANPSPAPAAAMALTAPIVDKETSASGYSYSMGVNVGTRLSERWVLQGGLNYLTHTSEYAANKVVMSSTGYQQQRFRAMSTNELINSDVADLNNKIVYSAPYNVNNSMRYLSIPMQAGYLLVNKTFGFQLNAGVATDLFLQNTIKADSDQLDKTSQSGGADSPYRAVNLSGLLGTEMSYRFGDHYRVSLNPGIRYPFNTIYKSELGVQSTPLTFDIGLRFRYIFR